MNGPVLVTGAYGLLGGWLTRALTAAGRPVVVIRRDRTPLSVMTVMDLEPRVTVVEGDITSAGFVQRLLAEYEIESVFHLAAQTLVPSANSNPISTFETNIRGTWLLLDACRVVGGVGSIVVAASDKAYGVHSDLPYRESHALTPLYPYDVSKAATDMIARTYWETFRLPVAVTRFANLYGGGDLNLSRLVPEAALAAIDGRRPVIRSDGTLQRDFLYVEDAVEAYLAICGLIDDGRGAGEAFNAGGDEPHSVREVVERMCAVAGTGLEPEIRGTGTPAGEITRQWVDSTKLRSASGWEPKVDLDDGLGRTIDWYRSFRDRL
jgi:CDP-glucose 4,6-dehydratase